MPWTMLSVIINLSTALVLALVYSYLYKLDRKSYIGFWASSWVVYSLGFVFVLLIMVKHQLVAFAIGNQLSAFISSLLLLWGAYSFTGRYISKWWLCSAILGAILTVTAGLLYFPFIWFTLFTFALYIFIHALAGLVFLRLQVILGTGKYITGCALILWGINKAIYTFLQPAAWLTPWSYLTAVVLVLTVSFSVLLVYFQKTRKDLKESEKHFRLLAENARDLIYRYRVAPTNGFDYVSPAAISITGYTPGEYYADPELYFRLVHPEDRSLLKAMEQSSGLFNEAVVLRWIHKDGKAIWIEQLNVPIYNEAGNLVAIEGIARDITERKRTEKVFKMVEERLRTAYRQVMDIIEFLPDPTFAIDGEGKVIAWNRALEEMTGVSKKHISGKGNYEYAVSFYGLPKPMLIDSILLNKGDPKVQYQNFELKESPLVAEIFAPCLYEGKGAYLWSTASPLFDGHGNLVGAIESLRDITERKEMEKQLKYLSTHDPLTKLSNRAYFEEEMRRLEGGGYDPVGIIVCDVDGLKLVNDTLGHEAGDKLLVATANVIRQPFQTDGVVARVGGDEFAVLLRKTSRATVESACKQIRDAVAEYNLGGSEIPLHLSLGFAVREDSYLSLASVFKEADNNMYREKLHSGQSARSTIVTSLMKMLETRDHITEGHGDRVQDLAVELAIALGLPEEKMNDLRLLAQFHDIGKVGIPDNILFKPASLAAEGEFSEMKRHCEIGYRIAQSVPELIPIASWILKHHEWWDGTGYPLGLQGEEIPLECRILAIVDAYDAMTNDRPYRKALSHSQAIAELMKHTGTQFDPYLVSLFLKVRQTMAGAKKTV